MSAVGAGILADPWGAAGGTGAEADPEEVTVQLDGPARRADGGGTSGPGAAHDGSDRPVFVDESGRRSRRYRRIGMAVGIACAVYAVVIVVTLLSGSSDAPWLPVPGQKDDAPAGKVDTSPVPSDSGRPTAGGDSVAPGNIPTASDGTTPSPGAKASASGASVAPGAKTSASASPGASASRSASAPTGGGASNPVVQPTRASSSPPADPTPTATVSAPVSPTPTPSATTGTGTGTGTVADGPSSPSPVAQGPAAPSEPAPTPSKTPEHIL